MISPMLGPNCRFYPTCSNYSKTCFGTYAPHIALGKSISRILRCHPWSKGGYDPAIKENENE